MKSSGAAAIRAEYAKANFPEFTDKLGYGTFHAFEETIMPQVNYFLASKNSFNAEFNAEGIAAVVFGMFYMVLNACFFYHDMSAERLAWLKKPKES